MSHEGWAVSVILFQMDQYHTHTMWTWQEYGELKHSKWRMHGPSGCQELCVSVKEHFAQLGWGPGRLLLPPELFISPLTAHKNSRGITHPSSEGLERIHSFLISCLVLAQIIRARTGRRWERIKLCNRPRDWLFSITLHIPNLFIQLQIVSLKCLDFTTEFWNNLELLS